MEVSREKAQKAQKAFMKSFVPFVLFCGWSLVVFSKSSRVNN